jgi:cysteine desulfurase
MLYFDHNATAPLHPVARDAWLAAAEQFPGNPSSLHRLGGRAEAALTDARLRLAKLLGCDAGDLVFTSGATESANLVLHHHVRTLSTDAEVWISAIEHPCVSDTAAHHFGKRLRTMPVKNSGVLDLEWLERELSNHHPGLVTLMAANNVTGALQPWREALALCRSHDVPFFCDAVQWIGRQPAAGLGECDWLSGCGHKAGGPRGVGFLKVPGAVRLQRLIHGGPQEDGRRAGTENVAGALAMTALLEHREQQTSELAERSGWRSAFCESLCHRLPGTEIIGNETAGLWNTVAALMPQTDCPNRWTVKLDKLGCAVSMGSACSSGKEEPSPVLLAMGCPPAKASRMLRFSAGWETTEADWDRLLEGVLAAARELGLPSASA